MLSKINPLIWEEKKIDKRISNSDIIFICTPVSLVDEILREIIPFVSKKNLITDTGSVKNIFETQTVKKYVKYQTLFLVIQ